MGNHLIVQVFGIAAGRKGKFCLGLFQTQYRRIGRALRSGVGIVRHAPCAHIAQPDKAQQLLRTRRCQHRHAVSGGSLAHCGSKLRLSVTVYLFQKGNTRIQRCPDGIRVLRRAPSSRTTSTGMKDCTSVWGVTFAREEKMVIRIENSSRK